MGDNLFEFKGILKFFGAKKGHVTVALAFVLISLCVTVVGFSMNSKKPEERIIAVSAVEVKFNGKSMGFVEDIAVAESIANSIGCDVYGDIDLSLLNFVEASVSPESITNGETIVSAVKNENLGIIDVCGVFVDNNLVAVAKTKAEFDALVDELTQKCTANGVEVVSITNNAEIRNICTTKEFFEQNKINSEALVNGDYGVQIKTKKTVTYEAKISYKTEKKYNNEKTTDYSKVLQEGKNGLKKVTDEVTYVNGVKSETKTLSSTVITEAVNKIVEYGNKRDYVYYKGYTLASSIYHADLAEMHFPVDFASNVYITSFWGDGRGHKGLDISASKGKNVYAALDGTVTYAGWNGGYGYLVVIQHDDKTATAYGHNSKLNVKVGDKVTKGQVIAKVGSTGNSTGPHVHFEVRINGNRVDAAPYLGLR